MKNDDVEFENFDIDEYDLANALNPGRPRKRASKNQQTYGIWAEDSDDDEYRPSFGGGGQNMSSMAKEVSFVSGGLKQPVDASNLERSDKADDEDEEENLDDEMIKAALSYSTLQAKKKHQSKMAGINREVAGLRSKKEQDFGSWEKYTKGIGQKLLLQMGYKPGKGLGKTLQGISEPVEAKKRSGKGTIGFYGSERTKTSLKHFPQDVTDEDEEKKFRKKLQQWKKKPGETSKKKKFNYIYRTVDDVKADGMTRKLTDFSYGSHLKNKDKVIDMTGPKQRVLSGYESLQHLHVRPETSTESESTVKMPQAKSFEMDALVHNIDMLVDLSEQEIISSDRELQYHKDRIVALKHQEETISRVLENEKSQIDAINELLKIVEEGQKALLNRFRKLVARKPI